MPKCSRGTPEDVLSHITTEQKYITQKKETGCRAVHCTNCTFVLSGKLILAGKAGREKEYRFGFMFSETSISQKKAESQRTAEVYQYQTKKS